MTGAPTRRDTRGRIVDAAAKLTIAVGWSNVTMTKLADAAGVSRQTVYNEFGSKSQLVQSMIMQELERFLMLVSQAFDDHPGDEPDELIAAIRQGAHDVLQQAAENPLLVSVVSATHGADTELLPYLTTQSDWLLEGAKAVLHERIGGYRTTLGPAETDIAVDVLLRAVLSHVMQPTGSPDQVADGIAWLVSRLLGTDFTLPEARSGAA